MCFFFLHYKLQTPMKAKHFSTWLGSWFDKPSVFFWEKPPSWLLLEPFTWDSSWKASTTYPWISRDFLWDVIFKLQMNIIFIIFHLPQNKNMHLTLKDYSHVLKNIVLMWNKSMSSYDRIRKALHTIISPSSFWWTLCQFRTVYLVNCVARVLTF